MPVDEDVYEKLQGEVDDNVEKLEVEYEKIFEATLESIEEFMSEISPVRED